MKFELIPLSYAYDALEPYIDAKTMEIHHGKHHQAYVDKLNAALEGQPKLLAMHVESILMNPAEVPENIRTPVRNQSGGVANHNFFWPILKKDIEPKGDVLEAIKKTFGSFDKFKEQFSASATALFGSGWAWLVLNNGRLEIMQTSNQDSPLSQGKVPLLTIDVWEHAYYLKYQNRRAEYVDAFWHVINWGKVNEHFKNAQKK